MNQMKNNLHKRVLAFALTFLMVLSVNMSTNTKSVYADDTVQTLGATLDTPKVGDTRTFQILDTSDLHGSFYNWNYSTNAQVNTGLAQISTLIKYFTSGSAFDVTTSSDKIAVGGTYSGLGALATPSPATTSSAALRADTILLDIGDTIQGNGTGNFLSADNNLDGTNPFPVIKGFNYLGYDYEILGNHEFNFGLAKLENAYRGITAKMISGNILKPDGSSKWAPYDIKQMPNNGPKVAIIGMTTPNVDKWDPATLAEENLKTASATVQIRNTIEDLKSKGLADVFVVAAHMSQTNEYDREGSGAISVLSDPVIADNLAIFLGAHGHTNTNTMINGVHYTENVNAGTTLGQVFITVTWDGTKWVLKNKKDDVKAAMLSVNTKDNVVTADQDYLNVVGLKADDATGKAFSNQTVGKLVGGPLVPEPTIKGQYQAYLQDTALSDLVNNVMIKYTKADLSGSAPLATSANAQEGTITKGTVSTIYKFDNNTLYTVSMTGAQFKQWMEWAYGYFGDYAGKVNNVAQPTNPGPAVDPKQDLTIPYGNGNMAGYNADTFAGLRYEVDLTQPIGKRIVNMKNMDNTAFDLTKTYTVAVNNYRATTQLLTNSTTGVFKPGEKTATLIEKDVASDLTDAGMMGLISDYIANQPDQTISNACDSNWNFINLNWDPALRALAVKAINDGRINPVNPADSYAMRAVKVADVLAIATPDERAAIGYKVVDVVGFNDFHGQLDEAMSNGAPAPTGTPGGAKLAAALKAELAKNPEGSILISAGDNYQGSAVSNLNMGKPVSDMFKYLGVKYSAIGNHEFDWNTTLFSQWATDGNFKFLCANLIDKATGKIPSFAQPTAVETINGMKVGFVGLITMETPTLVKADAIANFTFVDPITAAQPYVEQLRNDGCDIVIALTHLPSSQDASGVITGEAADFANGIKGVDAIISGHSHKEVNGKVNGIPVIQAYYNGRTFDKLSFVVDANKKVIGTAQALTQLYTAPTKVNLPVDATVQSMIKSYNDKLTPILSEVVGKSDAELTTKPQVADWADKLLYDYLLRTQGKPYVVIQNDGGWRSAGVPLLKGDITMKYMYDIMPFDNEVVMMTMKGSDLKAMLDKPDSAYGSNLDIWGMTRTAPYTELATGKALDENATYNVMCNDFMLTGGDKFDFSKKLTSKFLGVPLRTAMVDQLKFQMNGAVTPTGPKGGGSSSTDTPYTPPTTTPAVTNADVVTNDLGTVAASGDQKVTTTVNAATGSYTVATSFDDKGTASVSLSLASLTKALSKEGIQKVLINLDNFVYELPKTGVTDVVGLPEFMKAEGVSEKDLTVKVALTQVDATQPEIKDAMTEVTDGKLVSPIVDVQLTYVTPSGKEFNATAFNSYRSLYLELNSSLNGKVLAALALEKRQDGSYKASARPVKLVTENGNLYAQVHTGTHSLYTVVENDITFNDVADNFWAKKQIEECANRMFVAGVGEGNYNPTANITKAEFASLLVSTLGLTEVTPAQQPYSDVATGKWYYPKVATAKAAGLLDWNTAKTFSPNQPITLAEIAQCMAAVSKHVNNASLAVKDANILNKFADASSVNAKDLAAMQYCVENNMISGTPVNDATYLYPNKGITRAQAAVVIIKILGNLGMIQ